MDRIDELTNILKRLNKGEDPTMVKANARQFLSTINPKDLTIAEQRLVENGLSPSDLQKLCPLHMELLDDQAYKLKTALPPGHIIATLISEHETLLCFLDDLDFVNQSIQKMTEFLPQRSEYARLLHIAQQLIAAEPHHQREEEILFPELEKRGLFGPPMIMRNEHTELREYKSKLLNLAKNAAEMDFFDFCSRLAEIVEALLPALREHIFKENNILYPTALQVIDDEKVWMQLKRDCDRIGYCCFKQI